MTGLENTQDILSQRAVTLLTDSYKKGFDDGYETAKDRFIEFFTMCANDLNFKNDKNGKPS